MCSGHQKSSTVYNMSSLVKYISTAKTSLQIVRLKERKGRIHTNAHELGKKTTETHFKTGSLTQCIDTKLCREQLC